MNHGKRPLAIYWDASAILSALIRDVHSEKEWANKEGVHLLSSLAYSRRISMIDSVKMIRFFASIRMTVSIFPCAQPPFAASYRIAVQTITCPMGTSKQSSYW